MNDPVLIITGPTATGKTALADQLAEKFDGELISADSRQVYKGLDIVTGKDLPKNPIHGLDLVMPGQEWNAALFQEFAQKKISQIHAKNKLPIIVGGTGLYIKALLEPFDVKVIPDPKLREQLEKLPLKELQEKLKKLSPIRFNNMNHSDQNNPRRLVRAIEISIVSSLSAPAKGKKHKVQMGFDSLIIGLSAPLEYLESRIKARVIKRLAQDPRQELEYLKSFMSAPAKGKKHKVQMGFIFPAGTSLGYQELDQYYQEKINKKELINLWTTRERGYAKKQLTWFKKQPNFNWFDIRGENYQANVVDLVSAWYT